MLIVDDPLKMLIHAPGGHGKSALLASAVGDERLMPMLLLDFEGGLRSIRSRIERIQVDDLASRKPSIDKIDVIRIREYDDFNPIFDFLANDNEVYRSVAIDSLSETNYLLLMGTVVEDAIREDRKHKKDFAEQQDYLQSYNKLRKLVRYFRDLDMHMFFTASSLTEKGQLQPNLNGKLALEVPGLLDFCFYLAVIEEDDGTTNRVLVTDTMDKFYAKQRTDIDLKPLPNPFPYADLKKLADFLIDGLPFEEPNRSIPDEPVEQDADEAA